MKILIAIFLISLLIVQIFPQKQELQFAFAFSWLGGFCKPIGKKKRSPCAEPKYNLWDHQSFTIHGLWSQNRHTDPIFGGFNIKVIAQNKELSNNLMQYMPPQVKKGQSTFFLWSHEWQGQNDVHGHDYGHIQMDLYREKYEKLNELDRNKLIQENYFKEIVRFYSSYPKVKKLAKKILTGEELANLFNMSDPDWLDVSCADQNNVKEVKICVNLTKDGYVPSKCGFISGNCNKQTQFVLYDWQSTNQKRVMALDTLLMAFLHQSPHLVSNDIESNVLEEEENAEQGEGGEEREGEETADEGEEDWKKQSQQDDSIQIEKKSEQSTDDSIEL